MKNKTAKVAITLPISIIVVLISLSVNAQQSRQAFLDAVAKPVTAKGWIDFREGNSLNPQTLFDEHKEMFGLTTHDNMQQYRVQTDDIGFTHFRFQQYHKGLKIIGAETILHFNGQYLKSMNGHIAESLHLDVTPSITVEDGFQRAKETVKADIFVWEHPEVADALSRNSNGQKDFGKPAGELLICRKNPEGDFTSENLTLAYRYRMIVLPMYESKDFYIDAKSGEVIAAMPLVTNCNNNTGNTTWFGSQNFNAGYYGFPNNAWLLESHCPSEATMRSLRGDPAILYNYGDADGIWTDADGVNGYNQRAGVTTYYGIHKAYDYYKNTFSRLSYDDGNGQLDAFSEITGGVWLPSAENASWNSVTHHMSFGAGATSSATDDWNCLDIVGHELTHGVHQWSIGFNYQGQPGALDESFADIFGECIEAYAKGNALPDYLMGADRAAPIRSMINPNANFQPDTYLGTFWQPTSNPFDYGGVHTNSGVQNHWFYLLVMGGSGTNDHGDNFNVAGIGLNAARDITYRNMNVYLTTASIYTDSREGSLRAAQDLFGWCSNEMLQVAKAWYAVGVATYSPDWLYTVPCGNVINGSSYRAINALYTDGSCTTTLQSGQNAIFSSGFGGVTLYPGFTATAGCAFTAAIDYCNEGAYNLRAASSAPMTQESVLKKPEEKLKLITLYPNPANNFLYVEFESSETINDLKFTITDIQGRIIDTQPAGTAEAGEFKKVKIAVSQLPAGIYVLFIKEKQNSAFSKFVISR